MFVLEMMELGIGKKNIYLEGGLSLHSRVVMMKKEKEKKKTTWPTLVYYKIQAQQLTRKKETHLFLSKLVGWLIAFSLF
jgi:hypothetical protein